MVHFSSQTTIDRNCLLPLTVCSDGGLLAVPRRHLRRVTPTYTEKWLLLALPASKSIQNATFPCTLPWRLIKHSLIRCLPLVWIGWGCCPAQADGADVRKNRKSPASRSDVADSSVNTLLVSPRARVQPWTRSVFGFIRSSEQTNTCVYKPLPAPGPVDPYSSWASLNCDSPTRILQDALLRSSASVQQTGSLFMKFYRSPTKEEFWILLVYF